MSDKTLKDYEPSETPPALDISGTQPPEAARPYESTVGESAGNVFTQRGTKQQDATPQAAGESVFHPWKVSATDADPVAWAFTGDTVWGQGTEIVVADGTVVGDEGWVLLKTTRDEDSRDLDTAVVEFGSTVPESDYTDQYRVLAHVDSGRTPKVIQYQFEEIRIFEARAVVNGQFRLAGLDMSHRNFYELPPA